MRSDIVTFSLFITILGLVFLFLFTPEAVPSSMTHDDATVVFGVS